MPHSCHHGFQRTLTMSKQKPPIIVSALRLECCQSDEAATEAGIVSITVAFALIARWRTEWRHHVPALRWHTAWWPENRHCAIQVALILAAESWIGRKNYSRSGITHYSDFIIVCFRSGKIPFCQFRQNVLLQDLPVQGHHNPADSRLRNMSSSCFVINLWPRQNHLAEIDPG